MRPLALLLLVLAPGALAQETLRDPEPLLSVLGMAWDRAERRLPPPEAVWAEGERAAATWAVDLPELESASLKVVGGRVVLVRVEWVPDEMADFKQLSAMIRAQTGPPGADGYYSAEQVAQQLPGDAPPMEAAFRAEERAAYFRVPSE